MNQVNAPKGCKSKIFMFPSVSDPTLFLFWYCFLRGFNWNMYLFSFLYSELIFGIDCEFCVFFSQLCLKLDYHPLISTQTAKEQTVCIFLWSCCRTNCLRLSLVWNSLWASFLLSCWSIQVRLSLVTVPSTAQNKHRRAHTEKKATSANTILPFVWSSFVQRMWAKRTRNKASSVLVFCSYLHVCGGSGSLALVRCRPAGGRGRLLWP